MRDLRIEIGNCFFFKTNVTYFILNSYITNSSHKKFLKFCNQVQLLLLAFAFRFDARGTQLSYVSKWYFFPYEIQRYYRRVPLSDQKFIRRGEEYIRFTADRCKYRATAILRRRSPNPFTMLEEGAGEGRAKERLVIDCFRSNRLRRISKALARILAHS